MDMNVKPDKTRHFGRTISIIMGSLIGLLILVLFNFIGGNTGLFIVSMHNIDFLNETHNFNFTVPLFVFTLTILISGMITTFLITDKKRNGIFGGITGIIMVLISLIHCYLTGGIIFPSSSVIVSQLGTASIILDFITNAVPISMIGFIFGFLGGYLVDKILKHHPV